MLQPNTRYKVFKMPLWGDYYIMRDSDYGTKVMYLIMTYLTEHEESKLDATGKVVLRRGKNVFPVNIQQTFCYGNINFHTNSDDYNQLAQFDFCNIKGVHGQDIWSDYRYENHTCVSPISKVRWTETWDSRQYAQQCHGMIGKPERTIIFKLIR